MRAPDMKALGLCVARAAEAMVMQMPPIVETEGFIRARLLASQQVGGKDVLGCLGHGLITETEARDLVMAHIATWISHQNGAPEPSSDLWSSRALELEFEMALLGRAARTASSGSDRQR
jgi:hypothetical protein